MSIIKTNHVTPVEAIEAVKALRNFVITFGESDERKRETDRQRERIHSISFGDGRSLLETGHEGKMANETSRIFSLKHTMNVDITHENLRTY